MEPFRNLFCFLTAIVLVAGADDELLNFYKNEISKAQAKAQSYTVRNDSSSFRPKSNVINGKHFLFRHCVFVITITECLLNNHLKFFVNLQNGQSQTN